MAKNLEDVEACLGMRKEEAESDGEISDFD